MIEPATRTLLLVDDDEDVREHIARFLAQRRPSQRVLTAADAREAIAILEAQAVDIVLSDQRMAGRDGVSLLQEVRARWPRTTRIVMTAYADVVMALRAINEGHVHAFLEKPIHGDVLLAAIDSAVHRRGLPGAPPGGEVLLVEDDADIRRTVVSYFGLVMPDVRVDAVPSAGEGIRFLATHRVDVILADYHLPDMTGVQFLARAQESAPNARSIIISGAPPAGLAAEAQPGHIADRLFIKPMDMAAFARAVRHLLPRG